MATIQLWIAVHLPHLSIEAFARPDADAVGSVVLDGERVIETSPAARVAGIRNGMRRGSVTMLAPDTIMLERSRDREIGSFSAVGMAMLQYTPQVASAEESTLLLDVGASLTLFSGIRALCRRIQQDAAALGFTVSVACAPTSRGAWLLARGGRRLRRTMKMPTLERRLAQLPVMLIPAARKFADWFDGIGCTRIDELRRLPRPGLKRRCGQDLLNMLDAAHGLSAELHEWLTVPDAFRAELELFDRVEKADELLEGYHRLVLQLLGWLSARRLAVQRIVLEMVHERGRVAREPSKLEISLAEPTWHSEHLLKLIKERLGRHQLDTFAIGIVLEAVEVVPMAPRSETLFPDPSSTEQDQNKLLEVLTARLGSDNVLQPTPVADYRPENANLWSPVSAKLRAADLAAAMPDSSHYPRPTWLLAKPIQLLMRDNRPFYTSPLRIVSTPERIEAGWWDEGQSRDYFIAEGSEHALYWIYRQRMISEEGEPELRWFLHGQFG
jgi:protein ImuB